MTPATPVVLYCACSLDGFIAATDGSVGWLEAFSRDGEDYGYAGFLAGIGALFKRSRTYEQVLGLGAWPYAGRPCLVTTSQLPVPNDADVRFRGGDDLVALARSMLDAGLVDALDLALMPVLLGDGVPLFVPGVRPHGLNLSESRTHADGVVQLRYSVRDVG